MTTLHPTVIKLSVVDSPWSSNIARFEHIFVGRLSRDTTEEMLRAAFALKGGEVGAIEIVRNPATGLPRGFAFVKLLTPFDASIDPRALDGLASATVDSGKIEIQGVPVRRLWQPAS